MTARTELGPYFWIEGSNDDDAEEQRRSHAALLKAELAAVEAQLGNAHLLDVYQVQALQGRRSAARRELELLGEEV